MESDRLYLKLIIKELIPYLVGLTYDPAQPVASAALKCFEVFPYHYHLQLNVLESCAWEKTS